MVSGFSSTDHLHMAHALRLAERGAYTTKPNPMVGCVIVNGEEVVGEGFHQRAGDAHAEVFALQAAVWVEQQLPAIGDQQHVPLAELAGGGGFKQDRIAMRCEPMQRQQVGVGVQGEDVHRGPEEVREERALLPPGEGAPKGRMRVRVAGDV